MKSTIKILFFNIVVYTLSCNKLDISRINKITTDNIEISDSTITATGTIVDISKNGIVEYGHCWSEEPAPDINSFKTIYSSTNEKGQFLSILTNLKPNTIYYVRSYLTDDNEVKYGNEINFNSSVAGVNISTDGFQIISTSSVNVTGSISGIESVNILDYGNCWSLTDPPIITDNKTSYGVLNDGHNFNSTISELNMMIYYFVRSYAKVDESVYVYGNTIGIIIPDLIVRTDSFTLQGNSSALLIGELVSIGIFPVTEYGHCWAITTSTPSINNNRLSLGAATQTGSFNTTLQNMQTAVNYYYRAYAIFENTVRYGSIKNINN